MPKSNYKIGTFLTNSKSFSDILMYLGGHDKPTVEDPHSLHLRLPDDLKNVSNIIQYTEKKES